MPLFFFDVIDGETRPDETGVEFDDAWQAHDEAVRFMSGCLAEQPRLVRDQRGWRVQVRDGHGNVLFAVAAVTMAGTASSMVGRSQLPFAFTWSDSLQ